MVCRLSAALLALLFTSPIWAEDGNGANKNPASTAHLEAEAFGRLEKQLVALDAILLLQEERLETFESQMLVATDPAELARLEGLITRLTEILDEMEYQRDEITKQVQAMRALSKNYP